MSLFRALDLAAQAVQERVYGDAFVFTPRKRAKNVNGGWINDTSRAGLTLTAIYVERDAPINLPENSIPEQDHRAGVSAHVHAIEVDPRRWSIAPAMGDVFDSVPDGRRWQVESLDPTDVGRIICNVRLVGTI